MCRGRRSFLLLLRRFVRSRGQVLAKAVEAAFPALLTVSDPVLDRVQALDVQAAGADPSDLLRADQATRLEHRQVLDDGWQRHRQRLGEFADRRGTAAEVLDDAAPRRV